jgi:hypothetical protein
MEEVINAHKMRPAKPVAMKSLERPERILDIIEIGFKK